MRFSALTRPQLGPLGPLDGGTVFLVPNRTTSPEPVSEYRDVVGLNCSRGVLVPAR